MSTLHHAQSEPKPTGSAGEQFPQVFGRYLLMRRLSRGGMGEIFLGRHGLSGFEKLVVIKKVLPHLVEDEQFISRFIDEAQVAIKLQHAHIAQVFEVGRVGEEYFLALEYVEGRDLRRTLAEMHARGRRLPPDLALLIGRDVASGLSYAHRRTDVEGASLELVHCDISPPNVMVSFEGETKIIDFGIAKSAMRATDTDPKMGFGKFGYMAPEQLIRGGEVDVRTDIYAAGVVLYELLTGERMYKIGDSPDYRALARQVAKGQHPLPSHIVPELAPFDQLVAKALRPKPEQRYQTAAEFRDAIQHAMISVNPTVSPERLGDVIRELFADEVADERRAVAQVEETDLEPWVVELTTQSSSTISYAVANMPLVAAPDEPERRGPPPIPPRELSQRLRNGAQSSQPAVSGAISTDIAGTEIIERLSPEIARASTRRRRRRRRTRRMRGRRSLGIALGLGALLISGTVLALVLSGDDRSQSAVAAAGSPGQSRQSAASLADAGVEAALARAGSSMSSRKPTSLSIDTADTADTTDTPLGTQAARAAELEQGQRQKTPKLRRRNSPKKRGARRPAGKSAASRSKSKSRSKPKSAKKPKSGLERAEVKRRYSRLAGEYKRFKKLYGGRLESEWADLAHYTTFANSDDKLRVLNRRITKFRASMRKNRQ